MPRIARAIVLAVLGSLAVAGSVPSQPVADMELVTADRHLIVASLNTWHAGRGVDDGAAKIARFIEEEGADVVTLQETEGTLAAELAARLGWWAAQSSGSVAVLSRHPIVEVLRMDGEMEDKAIGARVRIAGASIPLTVWSVHLHYEPYGPYDAAIGGLAPPAIVEREHGSGRVRQTEAVLRAAADDLEAARRDRAALVVAGDWNTPSHLDWTPAAAFLHEGLVIGWPTSVAAERSGLRDVFREAHPDPVTVPGATWSPIHAVHEDAPDVPEPQDRIDRIYAAGPLAVVRAQAMVRGTPGAYPDVWRNEWPSDHAAVVAELEWE